MDLAVATGLVGNPDSTPEALESVAGLSAKLDRQIAVHRNANANVLSHLARSEDRVTRRNVVLNPQTPEKVLLKLAPSFPGAFFLNPAFDWLLLENPNLFKDLKQGVLSNILKRSDCPESFLRWAAAHGDKSEQLSVAKRPGTSLDLLKIIAVGPHVKAAEVAAGRLLSGH